MRLSRLILIATVAIVALSGCLQDEPLVPATPMEESSSQLKFQSPADVDRVLESLASEKRELPHLEALVQVPGGSVDALAAAMAAAGPGGTVVLQTGVHTESATVLISQTTTLLGEPGAVLRISTSSGSPTLDPGLYVKNADDVVIAGLTIEPTSAPGGMAVFVEHSARAIVASNTIRGHADGIGLHHGDQAAIWNNTIEGTFEDHGITVANGDQVRVEGNDVTGCIFGIWACDREGLLQGNSCHGNLIGIILCKVPQALVLPNGDVVGSEIPATEWLATGNNCFENLDAGYLVIDGARENLLKKNQASNNGTYDIELTGDTYRFGFLTPSSVENTVIVAGEKLIVKDCGQENVVKGVKLVDNSLDPCY